MNAALSRDSQEASHGWMMEEHGRQMNARAAPAEHEPEASSVPESEAEGSCVTNENSPELNPKHSQTTHLDNTIVALGEEIRGQLASASAESAVSNHANVDKASKEKKVWKARRRGKAKSSQKRRSDKSSQNDANKANDEFLVDEV